jgi:hydrogenase nickel incorporation protein HypA/HybF
MHELGLMENALAAALDHARRHGAERIVALRFRVGQMSGVVPDALAFAFKALAAGTVAEGARLDLDTVPVVCRCLDCGGEFRPEDVIYLCPHCGSLHADVRKGTELELASLEVE